MLNNVFKHCEAQLFLAEMSSDEIVCFNSSCTDKLFLGWKSSCQVLVRQIVMVNFL